MTFTDFRKKTAFFVEKYLYSLFYPFTLAFIVVLCWALEWEVAGLIIFIWTASLILFFVKDTTPLIPLIFCVAMLFPKSVDPLSYGWQVFLSFIPMPIAIIFHLIRFKSKLKVGKMFFPQLAIAVALILGGLGSIGFADYKRGIVFALLLGLAILFVYTIFYQYTKPPQGVDLKQYLAHALIAMGMILVIEQAIYFGRHPDLIFQVNIAPSLGWGISNNIATLLLVSIPMCFYMATQSKWAPAYLLAAALQVVTLIMTWSRGGVLVGLFMCPITLIYACFNVKHKKHFFFALLALLAVAVVMFAVLSKDISHILTSFVAEGLDSNGRIELYQEALECFRQNFLFGGGIGHNGPNYDIQVMPMYWFHSTLFQIIGSTGLVGIVAYAYYYFVRFSIVMRKRVFHLFVLLSFLGFEGYSMIDTGTFLPIPFMLMIILMTMMMEYINKQENCEKMQPLDEFSLIPENAEVSIG